MKKITYQLLILILSLHLHVSAQDKPLTDSSKTLKEVVITAFEQNRVVNCGTIVKVINSNNDDRYTKVSLVNSFNTLAGVRMEERSPGSYRINIRGSSLRSPFGVRNVKVYWNNIPMTDPSGNTYFNQFSFNNFSNIEIVKGPAGSLYGAGTGGLLLMHSFENDWKPAVKFEYVSGSYGLHNILSSVSFGEKNSRSVITYAHNQGDGYRDHTKSKKDNLSFVTQVKISDKQQITSSILYNNMYYETPGGLNQAEFNANPKQARPAAGSFPSADASKAAIYQKNFTAGISHSYNLVSGFKNTTSVYGTFNQIKNPAIRNYERRNEPGFGARTSFVYEKKIGESRLQFVTGGEFQAGYYNTQVFKNKNGNPDTLQTNDDIDYTTGNVFLQADVNIKNSWFFTAGLSISKSKVVFKRLNVYPVLEQPRTYRNEFSPRVALQKKINSNIELFASVSKGFSPPTISELLPSTGVISTFLEAEEGINYEFGGSVSLLKRRLNLDITGFYFKLNNALVTRKDSTNADYFVNAGNSKQKGIEVSADYTVSFSHGIMDHLTLGSSYTLNDFTYGDFKKGTVDYSGKYLPSVPKHTVSFLADLKFKANIYFNSTYYYASRIFLDDANTVSAGEYHLLGCRIGWKPVLRGGLELNFYVGADNLFNETYSLGNDINAAAGRFYNTAAKRNYYAGISFLWNHSAISKRHSISK